MNESPPSPEWRVDQICIEFESALQAGQCVRIEDYLANHPEVEASLLFRELLRLEVEYRRRRGEAPTVEEYCARFPTFASSIPAWFPCAPTIGFVATKRTHNWPKVPGYEITAELGRGAMGVVYQARHIELNRQVALKMILAGEYASPELTSRFLAEARIVASLKHPNCVPIYEIGENQGMPYFSLEFVDGSNLAKRIYDTPPSDMEAARIIEVLARAVHYAHGQGVLHRDLKPANILVTSDGVPKIADFGLAKILGEDSSHTQTGAVLGSPPYMAPEQASGRTWEIGPATDVYALGAILYEMLTGQPPFGGKTLMEILHKVEEQPPTPPQNHSPRVDRALQAICLKCLAKSPKDRYATAEALADDVAAFLRGEAVLANSGAATRLLGVVLRESRYTELMHLWSGIWMGLAVNAVWTSLGFSLLLWYDVHDYVPYSILWTAKMVLDFFLAWLLRIRNRPPVLPVERQLMQIWIFFWIGHFLYVWFYQRAGGDVQYFLPFIDLETALAMAAMSAILGGSFYFSAALCTIMALLDALWLGAGQLFGLSITCPAFFWLGWKHSRRPEVR